MLDIYTVAFFGHRRIYNYNILEKLLMQQLKKLVNENEYVDFLVGRNGDFDTLVSSCIKLFQANYSTCDNSHILILPYPTAEYENNKDSFEKYYNDIEICYEASVAFPKCAIEIRNRKMIDRADLVICYVEENQGGAYKAMQYALKTGKPVLNLAQKVKELL